MRATTAGFDGSVLSQGTLICGFALAAVIGAAKETEKSGPAPSRAGDRACNRGKAGIGSSLPIEAIRPDGDGVALSVIVADQHRSDFELPRPGAGLTCQTVEKLKALTIEAAEGGLLHSARHHSGQQVLAESRRRRSSEHQPPAAPKRIGAHEPSCSIAASIAAGSITCRRMIMRSAERR